MMTMAAMAVFPANLPARLRPVEESQPVDLQSSLAPEAVPDVF